MARKKEITLHPVKDGVMEVELLSWKHFTKFISHDLLNYTGYLFRGHANQDWKLESTLDRLAKKNELVEPGYRSAHLETFKLALRGRRGRHPEPLESDNEWWALGQHYGLATPLLDWTQSPFVALYFAFFDVEVNSDIRTIYCLHRDQVELKTRELKENDNTEKLVEFFMPKSEDNSRLVNQSGLFTEMSDKTDLKKWVTDHFQNHEKGAVLMEIKIPNKQRNDCLKNLNRMNINHLTLFPDISGATLHANNKAQIKNYCHF